MADRSAGSPADAGIAGSSQPRRRRWRWFWLAVGVVFLGLAVFTVGVTVWEYSNTAQFCGTTCHTMPPEYAAYQVSPHARVACVDCHLGEQSVLMAIPHKVMEVRHLVDALTQRWETPIYVKNLSPARDTCEQCHYPEKFSSDIITQIRHYQSDAKNTASTTWLVMNVGGGTELTGQGKGIHWHITNQVYFVATDPLRQDIPYVKSIDAGGNVTEYFDVTANLPADFAQQNAAKLHRMDCIDCHNRVAHEFPSANQVVDDALSRNQIDPGIPEIKARGVAVLSAGYASQDEAALAINGLVDVYRTSFPEYYQGHQAQVAQAVEVLKRGYQVSVFPDMDVASTTHPENTGHDQFPGCFRCHDGKHVTAQKQTIRLECNICHSLPVIQKAGEPVPSLPLQQGAEPASHQDTNWISAHRFQFDQTCAGCHDLSNPGGSDGSSFCSNSACHGRQWQFVGLNAPQVRLMVKPQNPPGTGLPAPVPHPIAQRTDCSICHAAGKVHPMPANHSGYGQGQCTACHVPAASERADTAAAGQAVVTPIATASPVVSGAATATQLPPTNRPATATPTPSAVPVSSSPTPAAAGGGAPLIPHTLTGRDQCLACHAPAGGIKPAPANHAGREVSTCQMCHKPSA
jgi:nitrate/TMAO reductase-like tetraheme cytochrome c subunit